MYYQSRPGKGGLKQFAAKGLKQFLMNIREVRMKRIVAALCLFLLALLLYGVVPAIAEDEGLDDYVHAATGSGPKVAIAPGIYAHIASRADAFLAGGAKTIFASDVKKKMDAGEELFIMDIRSRKDYLVGHIPGAVNIEFADAAKPQSLSQLPTDGTQIIVVCYTSQTGNQVTALLNVLGYDAWALRFGMMGWRSFTPMKIGSSTAANQNIYGAGYSVEAGE